MSNENITWHTTSVCKEQRSSRNNQKPVVIWFTGFSGSGKSTTASMLEVELFAKGYSTYLLDGDNIRHGLCQDLGFSDRDRVENIRRVGEVAKLMVDAGLIVITSFISPFRKERELVRQLMAEGEFIECYVHASLSTCEKRDPKGLYKKARAGEVRNFTGIDSPYEVPEAPELHLNTEEYSPIELVEQIIRHLRLA